MTGLLSRVRFDSIEDLLDDARSRLDRLDAGAAAAAVARGAMLVDIRPDAQRRREGEIPGSLIVERNHLEWRLHPRSDARLDRGIEGQRWIVVCSEGYTSSLAADALLSLGVQATDVIGGFHAWKAASLPTVVGGTPPETVVPEHR